MVDFTHDREDDDDKREAAAVRKQIRALQEVEDLKRLMGCPWGRRVAWRMLERAGVFRSSFSGDLASMSFNEGRRNEGLFLLSNIMDHCRAEYLILLKEQTEDEQND